MTDANISKRNGLSGTLTDEATLNIPAAEQSQPEDHAESGTPVNELEQIPRLGPVRRKALADAGISTIAQLRTLPFEDLAAIKYVGAGNARLIWTWLDSIKEPEADVAVPDVAAPVVAEDQPPAPPELLIEPEIVIPPLQLTDDLFSPETAIANQTAYDDLGQIDEAIASLKDAIPKKARNPRLKKQLQKVSASISEVPENLDQLSNAERADAAKTLDRIAKVLMAATEDGKLSEKKQQAVGTKLRKLRKRLDSVIDG